jgi:5-methylcytosine-specific restriction endonuclease McrA
VAAIKEVLLLLDPRCKQCGVEGNAETLECDHVVPRSEGGASVAHNAQLLCR